MLNSITVNRFFKNDGGESTNKTDLTDISIHLTEFRANLCTPVRTMKFLEHCPFHLIRSVFAYLERE